MNGGRPLAGQMAALEARGDRLEQWGKRLGLSALAVLGTTALVYWPDPAGNGAFDTYVALPASIEAYLRARGVHLASVLPSLLANGMSNRWTFALAFPVIFGVHRLLRRIVPSRVAQLAMLWTSPLWLGSVLGLFSGPAPPQLPAARTGVVVDRPGAPPAAATGTGRPIVPAYTLRPDGMAPRMADQAHYVLAQQSYLDARPDRTAAHLRAMAGAWQPHDRRHRTRVGILAEYARRNGADPGVQAPRLSDGQPYALAFRRILTVAIVAIATALGSAGFLLSAFGTRRRTRASALSLKAGGGEAVLAARRPGFGRRVRAPV